MFLYQEKQNQYVLDYQLIYDLDSPLHADFYGDGLQKEAGVFGVSTPFQKKGNGFFVADEEEFEEYESLFAQKAEEDKHTIIKDMARSLIVVHKLSRKMEGMLQTGNISSSFVETYYHSILDMMKYKRISDFYQEKYEEYGKEIRQPSHLRRLMHAIESVKRNQTKENIQKFISYEAFLFRFSMKENELEKEESLRPWLANYISKERKHNRGRLPENEEEKIVRYVGWYEEMRHYYQLRALRNFRLLFERKNLNIHRCSMDDYRK